MTTYTIQVDTASGTYYQKITATRRDDVVRQVKAGNFNRPDSRILWVTVTGIGIKPIRIDGKKIAA